jgi:YlmC/YmxH family sporulation protein
MRFCELCNKEVINANDCRCLGNVRDIEIDTECGAVRAIIVPGPGKYMGCLVREFEFCIPWVKIIRTGPDIILVDLDEPEMKRKIQH